MQRNSTMQQTNTWNHINNPDTWNNKTIILHDELLSGAHEGKLFNDHKVTLLEHDVADEVFEQKYQGAWFMSDN